MTEQGHQRISIRLLRSDGANSTLEPGHYWTLDSAENETETSWHGPFETQDGATQGAIAHIKKAALAATKSFFEDL